jgi:translation initiation factor 1 (eIF-1/SUI1)
MVRLDALLHAVLASANENLNEMKREEIVQRLTTKMQPWHIIRRGNEQSIKYVNRRHWLAALTT